MLLDWLRRRTPSPRRSAPEAEWLEPRLLYSADAAAAWLPGPLTSEEDAETRSLNAAGEYASASTASSQGIAQAYATTALNFERNVGQEAEGLDFVARGSGYAIGLDDGEAVIALAGAQDLVRLELLEAATGLQAHGEGLLQARSNYLVGNDPSQWRTGIENYAAVRYHDVWQGIDVRYYGTQRQLEYDFIVDPGVDAGQIRLRFTGADASVDADGSMVLRTPEGRELRFAAPVSFQEGPAGREAVASRYEVHADGSFGFWLGAYDASRTLVIDPVLSYATYFGDGGSETATDVAVDSAGNVYITGHTDSTTGLLGSVTGLLGGLLGTTGQDVYVAKFNADLSTLLWVARVGGSSADQGLSIAVDGTSAVVTGWTESSDFSTKAAADSSFNGIRDAFVFKLNATGDDLVFSTFFGSSGNAAERGEAVAVDASGNVYVTGGVSPTATSDLDLFLNKYSSAGVLEFQTTITAAGKMEHGKDIALDGSGNIYIAGNLDASGPALSGGAQTAPGLKEEGVLLRFTSSGTLQWGTYISSEPPGVTIVSAADDRVTALAVDASGRAYVVGQTEKSDASGFVTTPGALRTIRVPTLTGFLRVYDTNLTGADSLLYSTFIGGSNTTGGKTGDLPTGVALAGNRVVVVSRTDSSDMAVTADAVQTTNAGRAMHVAVIAPLGQGTADLRYGTYYGSNVTPGTVALAPDTQRLYVPATTSTTGLAVSGAHDTTANGVDAFVAAFTLNAAPVLTATSNLPGALEDSAAGTGVLVSSLFTSTDADASALRGIAITAADNSNGSWQYALDGSTWATVGTRSAGSALLLAADGQARVRFVANQHFAGSAGLTFRAWDRTSGSVGGTADTTANGGGSAFSTAEGTSSVTFTAVNDIPASSGLPASVFLSEGTSSLGLGSVSYGPGGGADEAGQTLSVSVTEVPLTTVGRVVLAGGTSVTAGSTYTVAELQGMQFVAASGITSGSGTFAFNVVDSGGTADGGNDTLAQSLTINVTNQAPVLTGANPLPSILEGAVGGSGVLVADVLDGHASDAGGLLGIAVTAQSSPSGSRWEYSLDGGASWNNIASTVSASNARLLPETARLRYVPGADWNGTGTLTFRAWDQSVGTVGGTADVRTNGGSTAYSADTAVTSIVVLAVNDEPVRSGALAPRSEPEGYDGSLLLGSTSYLPGGGGDEAGQVLTVVVTDIPDAAFGRVTTDDGTPVAVGGTYTVAQWQGFRFVAAPGVRSGSDTLGFDVRDDGGTANGGDDTLAQVLTISIYNVAPVLNGVNAFPQLTEDPAVNNGLRVAELVAGQISDPSNVYGIAVTGAASANGAWQFSRDDGATWASLASASNSNAFLFAADTQNRIRFAPNANWSGTDTGLSIRAWDGSGGTDGSTTWNITSTGGTTAFSTSQRNASITVTAVDDATVAVADSQTILEDSSASGNVLANDVDVDSPLAVASFTIGADPTVYTAGQTATLAGIGSFSLAANGAYLFTPVADWNGDAPVVAYTTTTGASSTLTLRVDPVNDAPVATAVTAAGLEDASAIVVALSGTDPDGPVTGFVLQGLPADGTLYTDAGLTTAAASGTTYASGTFWFVPAADWYGATTFDYRVSDAEGALSAPVTATISVTSVNDLPVADPASLTAPEDSAGIAIALTGQDVDGTIASFTLLNLPANGVLYRDAALTIEATAGTAYTSGNFWFVPAGDFHGTTGFDFRVTDDEGGVSAPATAAIAITSVNDAPIANTTSASGEEDAASIAVMLAGNDVDGTIVSYTLQTLPTDGLLYTDAGLTSLAVTGTAYASPDFWFVPTADFNGSVGFQYQVTDDEGALSAAAATAGITVTAVNDAPTASALTVSGPEDGGAIAITLAGSDREGAITSYSLQGLPADGQLYTDAGLTTLAVAGTAYADSSFWFVPAADFNGGTSFAYEVADAEGAASAAALVSIIVTSVNDAPTPNDVSVSGLEDGGAIAIVLAGSDEDGTIASFTLQGLPADGSLYTDAALTTLAAAGVAYASGSFWFVPDADFGGTASFAYRVTDNEGLLSAGAATASIIVAPVNDAPVAAAVTASGNEDGGAIALTLAGTDVDGSVTGFNLQGLPANGTLYADAALTVVAAAGASYADGSFWFVPQANFSGTTSFSYRVQDDQGALSAAAVASITVNPVNDAPVADPAAAWGLQDSASIPITLTGADVDGSIAGFTLDDLPTDGVLYTDAGLTTAAVVGTPYASGDFWFVPAFQFEGTVTFGFRVTDDQGLASAAATATITVGGTNDPPVPAAVTVTGTEDAPSIAITVSATDVDNAVASFTLQSLPADGVLYADAGLTTAAVVGTAYTGDTFWFVPRADFNGTASFAYRATDEAGLTSVGAATVTINVTPVNDAPVAHAAAAAGLEDAASIAITLGGSDVDGSIAGFTLQSLPANGVLYTDAGLTTLAATGTGYASGAFWFRPDSNFSGNTTFTYQVTDDSGATSAAAATATLTVTAVNDAPTAAAVTATGPEDASSIAIVLAGSDIDGTIAGFTLQSLPASGTLYTNAGLTTVAAIGTSYAAGSFWFVPAANFNGQLTFGYRVTDNQGATSAAAVATLDVTPVNDAPVAAAINVTAAEDAAAVAITLAGSDLDGTVVSYTLQSLPANGALYMDAGLTTLAVTANPYAGGNFWFVPSANFNGLTGFSYRVSDDLGALSAAAPVAISISPVNDAPVANAVTATGAEDGGAIAITLSGSDVEGAIASFTLQGLPANGTLFRDAALTQVASAGTAYVSGSFWFAPAANYNGSTSFAYRVTDGQGASSAAATATITVTAVNDPPIANAVSASGLEDASAIAITLAGNDVDGTIAAYTLQGLPANGRLYTDAALSTLAVAGSTYASNSFWFVPDANFNGSTSFAYGVTDNQGLASTATATASITVTAVNDAPVASAAAASGPEDAPSIAITLAGSDVDGTIASFTLQTLPASGTLYQDAGLTSAAATGTAYAGGTFWFKPAANFNGSTSFSYRVTDNQGASSAAAATATITVSAVNDAPVPADVTASGPEDAASIAVVLGGSDVEGGIASFTVANLPANGRLYADAALTTPVAAGSVHASGNFWFVPDADFNGATGFDYRVTDAQGLESTGTGRATINVAAVNDEPAAAAVSVSAQEDVASVAITLAGTDIDGTIASFTLQDLPANGVLYTDAALTTAAVTGTVYTLGSFWFVPEADFSGSTSFSYVVSDDQGASSPLAATVTITVTAVNDAPVAAPLTVTGTEDAAIALTLAGSDVDGAVASFTLQDLPANGVLYTDAALTTAAVTGTAYTSGGFWFAPAADWSGSTGFSYRVTDDAGAVSAAAAAVAIEVTAVNDPPTASATAATGTEDAASIAISLSGGDIDGTVTAFILQALPANGRLYADAALTTLASTGTAYAGDDFWFVPAADFNGTTSFSYVVRDDQGATSATAVASITVTAVNDAPVPANVSVTGAEDAAAIAVTLAGSDVDGTVQGFTLQDLPASGRLYTDAGLGTLAATGVRYTSGSFWFVPAADFNGTTRFDYRVTDGDGAESAGVATATIVVTPVNDAPRGAAVTATGAEDAASIAITLGGSDVDGTIASFTLQSLPDDGVLFTDAGLTTQATVGASYASGSFWFVPDRDFNGSSTFTYRVTDDLGVISAADATARLDVTPVNDAPTAAPVTATGVEDARSIPISLAGADIDGTIAGFTLQNLPADGVLYTDAALTSAAVAGTTYTGGDFWFVPRAEFNGSTGFDYRVTDDQGGVAAVAATARIDVLPVNDAPTAAAVTATGAEDAGAIRITLAGSDVDGTIAGFTLQNLPANGVLYTDAGLTTVAVAGSAYATGTFWFVPNADFNGSVSFAYGVTDDLGVASAQATAAITVTPVNDAPLASSVVAAGLEDAAAIVVTLGGSDVDGTIAGFVLENLPAGGILYTDATLATRAAAGAVLAGSNVWFVPSRDFNGVTGFDYRSADAQGARAAVAATAAITVTAVNDAPVRTGELPAVTALEGAGVSLGLDAVNYSAGGGADEAGQALAATLTELPDAALGHLVLADGTTPVLAGARYTIAELQGMRFVPAAGISSGGGSVGFTVSDDGGQANGATDSLVQRVAITVVNQAPVLVGSDVVLSLLEDATDNAGVLVADLLAGRMRDPGTFTGLAVTAASDDNGRWEYSRDGGASWRSLAGSSEHDATLLRGDDQARIRFVPKADWNGTAGGLAFRAWDGTGGTDALLQADARVHGGTSAFSDASASLTARVLPVNDAPSADAPIAAAPVVANDGTTVSLGLHQVRFGTGGGDDEGSQTLAIIITAVPERSVGVVLLADGTTEVRAGGSYTLSQFQGMQFRAAGGGTVQAAQLAWIVRDSGGTAGGGQDQTTGGLSFTVAAAAASGLAPDAAPAPAQAAPPAAAAGPATSTAPAAAPAVMGAAPRAQASGGGLEEALAGGPGAAGGSGAPGDIGAVATAERRMVVVDPVRPSAASLLDRGSVQLVGFQSVPSEFTVMGFAGQSVASARMTVEELQVALRSGQMIDELNKLRDHLRQEFDLDKTVSISVAGLSLGVSVLYVLWLIRGGVLIGSYLSALPAWRILDPLPVLAHGGDEEDEDDDALDGAADKPGDPLRGIA